MNMKKLLSLLLALMMVFALAACGESDGGKDDDDEEEEGPVSIIGTWEGTMEFTGEDMGLEDLDIEYEVDFEITFDEDGTCCAVIDEKDMEEFSIELTIQMLYETLGGEDEAEAYMEEEYGMSCKEYAEDEIEGSFSEDDLEEECDYTYEDGVLELDGEELECTIKGSKMTLEGDSEFLGIEDDSITLKKKK